MTKRQKAKFEAIFTEGFIAGYNAAKAGRILMHTPGKMKPEVFAAWASAWKQGANSFHMEGEAR